MKSYHLRPVVLAFITIIITGAHLWANKIDSLKTDNDVLEFLKMTNENFRSGKYDKIELRSTETIRTDLDCDGMAAAWQIKNWEKADFNGDGLTDLLVTLYWYDYGVYVVMDKGNSKFELLTLSYNIYEKCELAKPIMVKDQELLLFYEKRLPGMVPTGAKGIKAMNQVDTLIYKYGDFIELNRQPPVYDIDSIEFRTGPCFGSCPVFSIAFDKNGHAEYSAEVYNPKQGKFSAVLKKNSLEEIMSIINYMQVTKLLYDYSVSWKDDQTCWLRIRFSNGTIKEIKDYGMRGSFGLRLLYNKFYDLRRDQEWK